MHSFDREVEMKANLRGIVFVTALILNLYAIKQAHAGLIVHSQSQQITEAGQSFVFEFDELPSQIDGSLDFFIHANGDFSDNNEDEYLEFILNNLFVGILMDESGLSEEFRDLSNIFSSVEFELHRVLLRLDTEFTATFTLTNLAKERFLSAVKREVFIELGSDSDPNYQLKIESGLFLNQELDIDFVEVGFSYQTNEVPEPQTFLLVSVVLSFFARNKIKLHPNKRHSII